MAAGEEFTWLATDADGNSLDVEVAYLPGSEGVYTLNATAFIASLEYFFKRASSSNNCNS